MYFNNATIKQLNKNNFQGLDVRNTYVGTWKYAYT